MASVDRIERELGDAKTGYRRCVEELKEFRKGEKGDRLEELKKNLREKEDVDEKQRNKWIEEKEDLEKQEKKLKASKDRWELQMQRFQNALLETAKTGLFLNETSRYYLRCWLNWAYPFAFYFDAGFTGGPSASGLQSSKYIDETSRGLRRCLLSPSGTVRDELDVAAF
ncbi:hypothetical protein G9A89_004598 [Geosiphon pyriformis]|nr:hypothetical protein G9A89_004598 [Geosiphon pyriformis]